MFECKRQRANHVAQEQKTGALMRWAERKAAVHSRHQLIGPAGRILGWQQALGNQAVQQRASACPDFSACPTGGMCHTCPARAQRSVAGRLQRQPLVISRQEEFPREPRFVPHRIIPPELPVTFVHFRNSGSTSTEACGGTRLGVDTYGMLYNAMEMRFDAPPGLSRRYPNYRFRRTIEEQLWQEVGGRWLRLSAEPAGTPDDPSLDPACTQPPNLYTFDLPGWFTLPSASTLPSFDGRSTDPSATQVVLQQNFREWVEGQTPEGGWRRVSRVVHWHSLQWVRRTSPGDVWQPTTASEIELGHLGMGRPTGIPALRSAGAVPPAGGHERTAGRARSVGRVRAFHGRSSVIQASHSTVRLWRDQRGPSRVEALSGREILLTRADGGIELFPPEALRAAISEEEAPIQRYLDENSDRLQGLSMEDLVRRVRRHVPSARRLARLQLEGLIREWAQRHDIDIPPVSWVPETAPPREEPEEWSGGLFEALETAIGNLKDFIETLTRHGNPDTIEVELGFSGMRTAMQRSGFRFQWAVGWRGQLGATVARRVYNGELSIALNSDWIAPEKGPSYSATIQFGPGQPSFARVEEILTRAGGDLTDYLRRLVSSGYDVTEEDVESAELTIEDIASRISDAVDQVKAMMEEAPPPISFSVQIGRGRLGLAPRRAGEAEPPLGFFVQGMMTFHF